MKRLLLALSVVAVCATVIAGAAPARTAALPTVPRGAGDALAVGVNDDAPKDGSVSSFFWTTFKSTGLNVETLTIRWDDASPTTIPGQANVAAAIAKAPAGTTIELDLYPLHSQIFTAGQKCAASTDPESCGDANLIQQFGTWTGIVANAFPTVSSFVVMNECNQPQFVNPQFDAAGQNQSAEVCGRALAAGYKAIHATGSGKTVFGVGLSPRGNDNANATSNSSTSSVQFLSALGAWYRAYAKKTGTGQIMDGFDFHPYKVPQTSQTSSWMSYGGNANEASIDDLSRIYQAFYSAFSGTSQPTIGQQAGGGLPVSLNETGFQTDETGNAGYSGTEPPTGGAVGASQSDQAGWYSQMLAKVACDPNIAFVNIFHLIDESDLGGWQSGLYQASLTAKQAASTVGSFLSGGAKCSGAMKPWTASGTTPPAATGTSGVGTVPPPYAIGFPPAILQGFVNLVNVSFTGLTFTITTGLFKADGTITVSLSIPATHGLRATAGKKRVVAQKTVAFHKGKKLTLKLAFPKTALTGKYVLTTTFKSKAVKGKKAKVATASSKPFTYTAAAKKKK